MTAVEIINIKTKNAEINIITRMFDPSSVQVCVSASLPSSVPQLFESVHVRVWGSPSEQSAGAQVVQLQLGVQEVAQVRVSAGLLVVTLQLFRSVQVVVCALFVQMLQAKQDQFGVQEGATVTFPPRSSLTPECRRPETESELPATLQEKPPAEPGQFNMNSPGLPQLRETELVVLSLMQTLELVVFILSMRKVFDSSIPFTMR